jgi:hypothetical protein
MQWEIRRFDIAIGEVSVVGYGLSMARGLVTRVCF